MKKYIRIGELPEDGKSKIWRSGEQIGEENGISCYECMFSNERWNIILPSPINEAKILSLYGLLSQLGLLYKVTDPQKAYLVEGELIGHGTDNEPLLKNVKILEDITKDLTYN